jgi:hypothetical protein
MVLAPAAVQVWNSLDFDALWQRSFRRATSSLANAGWQASHEEFDHKMSAHCQ